MNHRAMVDKKHTAPNILLRQIPADVLDKVKEMQYQILKSNPTRTKVGLAEAIFKLIRNSKL